MPAPEESALTKADLRAAVVELHEHLSTTGGDLRKLLSTSEVDLRQLLSVTEATLREFLSATVVELREYIDERTRDMQTELLRAFLEYNNSAGVRFRKLEADTSNIDTSTTQRLGELERLFVDLRARLMALEAQR